MRKIIESNEITVVKKKQEIFLFEFFCMEEKEKFFEDIVSKERKIQHKGIECIKSFN